MITTSPAIFEREPEPLPKGLDAVAHALTGRLRRRETQLAALQSDAQKVDALAAQSAGLSDHALRERLGRFRDDFRRGGRGVEPNVIPALAAIREAAARSLGQRPFVVQIVGALALYRGWLAEMATGEGKTLTAGLAATLAGWKGFPVHLVTVNDYLVKRDADQIQPLYQFVGIRVGMVTGLQREAERKHGHSADVTYTTSKELLADHLRDRLLLGVAVHPTRRLIHDLLARAEVHQNPRQPVLRGLHTAIVDEADSVLIDEAATPLIISNPRRNEELRKAVLEAERLGSLLGPGDDYRLNSRHREIELTAAGEERLADLCRDRPGLWRGPDRRNELIRQALTAREYFLPGRQYILKDGKIVIVDEFTGRPMPQRTWRQGLHQAIEAKERIELSDPSETVARLSFQRFFRSFHQLSGMTGTAREAATEFWQIYRLAVVRIPTNRPCVRTQWPARYFATETDKWNAIATSVFNVNASGRPVLVGTRSVAASETLAALLETRGLETQVINASREEDEAAIVSLAGQPGRITIATNMAGRGTDIQLGNHVAASGGLHVIATERHESKRIDRQLFGRSARQGDPGSAQQFASAEDELARRFLPSGLQLLMNKAPQALGHLLLAQAQRRAESMASQQRQAVLRADTWLEQSLAFAGTAV